MRKLKTAAIVAATAALIFVCAFLPHTILTIFSGDGETGYIDFDAVSAELEMIEPGTSLSMKRKLAIMSQPNMFTSTNHDPALDESIVFERTNTIIDGLQNAGLLTWYGTADNNAAPMIRYDIGTIHNIVHYWTVGFAGFAPTGRTGSYLVTYIDDETESLLGISYTAPKPLQAMPAEGTDEERAELRMETIDTLAAIYFEQLGLMDEAEKNKSRNGYYRIIHNTDSTSCHYLFADSEYGAFEIDFYATDGGDFRIEYTS